MGQITITETTVIEADEVINYVYQGPDNGAFYVTPGSQDALPDFTNNGTINVIDHAIDSWGVKGVMYSGGAPSMLFLNNGLITVISDHGDEAVGIGAFDGSPRFQNTGQIITKAAEGVATGVRTTTFFSSDAEIVTNSGSISAEGWGARGVVFQFGSMENSGTITARGSGNASGHGDNLFYEVTAVGAVQLNLLNTGTITADNDGATDAIGVWIRPDAFNAPRDSVIDNRGTITGDYAIQEWNQAYVSTQVFNTGVLNGKIDLGGGDDVLINSGQINGTTQLGSGADYYDGHLGFSSGFIDGGSGADILIGGSGADDLRGGDDNDVLAGGGGADRLTGGAGADIFVLEAAGGSDTVADFDIAQDRFSLGGQLFQSATLSGSATVLAYAGGSVKVEGVTGLSLDQWNALVTQTVVHGTGGDDVLVSTSLGEIFVGGSGRDTVSWASVAQGVTVDLSLASAQETGEGGRDTLTGIENLTGSSHADTLTGDSGMNLLRGLDGADVLRGLAADDVLDGGLGDDILDGGDGVDVADYSQASAGVTVDLSRQVQTTVMGTDTFYSIEAVLGSSFDDVLTGGRLQGGAGNDRLLGTSGADLQIGDAGDDWLDGAGGADDLRGGAGADHIEGGDGDDTITGGDGDDVIAGGEGLDLITGGAGADIFVYRSVNDSHFVPAYQSSTGRQIVPDLIQDFQTGVDAIDVSALGATSYTVTNDVGAQTLHVTTPTGVLDIRIWGQIATGDVIFTWADQTLTGTSGYDQLIGGGGADTLWGQGGGDSLTGGRGADIFRYTAASDSTSSAYDIITDFQTGVDKIDLTALQPTYISMVHYQGATYLFPTTSDGNMQIAAIGDVRATDILTGAATNYYIVGDDSGLTLAGGANADTVVGGAGADVIIGGDGGDSLYGGGGQNTFAYSSATNSNNQNLDIIHDFKTGVDKLDLTALNPSNVSIIHYQGGTFVNGATASGTFQIASTETINGGDITGLVGGVYIVGENTATTLVGSANSDTIVGGSANDVIAGGASGDALFGGAGADTFVFSRATDSNGDAGMLDIIHDFQTGVDKIDLSGLKPTNVSLIHYNGGTFLFGQSSGSAFEVASTQDINAADILGVTGGITMFGDDQGQTLVGGAANDIIIGGGGADALFGGGGADTFRYLKASDSTPAAYDIIHDFQTGVDKIDLSALHTSSLDKYSLISDGHASYLFVQLAGHVDNDLQILFATPDVRTTDIIW